jgi:hypothetical protein
MQSKFKYESIINRKDLKFVDNLDLSTVNYIKEQYIPQETFYKTYYSILLIF